MLTRCLISILVVTIGLVISFRAYPEGPWGLRLIDKNGFDDPQNTGVVKAKVYGNHICLGTWNTANGGKVYRSKDCETWELISTGGFGTENNFCVLSFEWFKGKL